MNDIPLENEVSTSPAPDQAAPVAAAPVAPVFDPRRRIRELLSIPERDRTDADWDELNELEIQTAPGNRTSNQPPLAYSGKPSGGGGGGMPSKNRFKGKPRKPGQGGGGGSGGGGRPPQSGSNKPNNKPRPA
ncbi:MAG: hypothetical protein Q8M20_03935 [Rhodocyclaceae bacterium]|nr:hypothetical protein [Rhodocyclaceae bacterium]MDZ4213908.1 hypothetical protein [Rhodocyclaceae bacterium]